MSRLLQMNHITWNEHVQDKHKPRVGFTGVAIVDAPARRSAYNLSVIHFFLFKEVHHGASQAQAAEGRDLLNRFRGPQAGGKRSSRDRAHGKGHGPSGREVRGRPEHRIVPAGHPRDADAELSFATQAVCGHKPEGHNPRGSETEAAEALDELSCLDVWRASALFVSELE